MLVLGCLSILPASSVGASRAFAPGSSTVAVAAPPAPVVSVGGGFGHSCALDAGGVVSCWGSNSSGQLGDGFTVPSLTRRAVWGRSDAVLLAVGGSHACALSRLGGGSYLFCWGADLDGQLGDGPLVHPPPMVPGGPPGPRPSMVFGGFVADELVAVAAGWFTTCVLEGSGAVWCWGANDHGQLGDGTTVMASAPVQVGGGIDAIGMDSGLSHTCAVERSGSVRCWGANDHGQLGDGTTSDRLTPTLVSGVTDAVAVATGSQHSCALRAGGGVACWGRNDRGQLGDGTSTDRSSPVPVSTISGASAIAAENGHSCAVVSGTARCWGGNSFGQLGDGTLVDAPVPVVVSDLTDVSTIGLGQFHSCAVRTDRSVWCWGDNTSGELGDGTRTARTRPTAVRGTPPERFGTPPQGRVLDTRAGGATIDGAGSGAGLRAGGTTTVVPVAGRGGIPIDAAAVVLNVTATEPSAGGFVSVFPCGGARPWVSNLNFGARQTVANAVTVAVGANGDVCLYNEGASTHLVVDVTGYHPHGDEFGAVPPARLFDSRAGAATVDGADAGLGLRPAGSLTTLTVAGRAGVPLDAESAVLNLTATGAAGAGFVTVWPCGAPFPPTSSVNVDAGQTVANAVTTGIGTAGQVCVWVDGAASHLVIDLNGFYAAGAGFEPILPARLADTRQTEPLRNGTANWVMTRNRGAIAPDAAVVVLNVTVTEATGTGFLTVWPCDQPRPWASSINFTAGQTVANQVTVLIGQYGWICSYSQGADVQVIYDATGYHPNPGAFA